ncbi:hypothetical protein GA0115251_117131, partial [Streptomyces sp. TverLS-915]|uniref:extensin n=1 Tax=Streptomyces sp. TverLS-915 TaxID=1839763 RepID=UPI00081D8FB5
PVRASAPGGTAPTVQRRTSAVPLRRAPARTTGAPPAVARPFPARPLPVPSSTAATPAPEENTAPPAPPAPKEKAPPAPTPVPLAVQRAAAQLPTSARTTTPPQSPTVQRRAAPLPPPGEPRTETKRTGEPAPAPGTSFDPRALNDFQLDELTHRLTGRITRLLRTELRLDRERVGRLRDPRQ